MIILFVKKKLHEAELHPQGIIQKTLDGYETDVQIEIRIGDPDNMPFTI